MFIVIVRLPMSRSKFSDSTARSRTTMGWRQIVDGRGSRKAQLHPNSKVPPCVVVCRLHESPKISVCWFQVEGEI